MAAIPDWLYALKPPTAVESGYQNVENNAKCTDPEFDSLPALLMLALEYTINDQFKLTVD